MSARLRIIATALCLVAPGLVVAQGQPRARQRANTPRGRMNQGNPEATRQQMMQRMQQQLDASAEEWQVIWPRLEKVVELTRQTSRRGLGALQARPGGRRGTGQQAQGPRRQAQRPRNNSNREPSPVQKASEELRTLLGDASAGPDQVQAKLAALRQAREAAQQNLAQARTELQQVLSVKQEARLVLMGLLG